MKYAQRARAILDIELEGLRQVRAGLGRDFDRAVEVMLERLAAGGKIVVTGVGKNLPVGQKIAATLSSTGSPAVVLHASDALHGDLGILADQDAVLALSYSGESEELTALLPAIKRRKIPIVSLTGSRDNALARVSEVVVLVTVHREACPFNMAPTTSTTVTLAVGDALAMVLLEARGFRREDYAKLHPGGAIGRTLLLRVRDIMRKGDRLAAVREDARVQDALVAMTRARSGAVAVVNARRHVTGIFTDGDLRRHLTTTPDLTRRLMREVMSADPRTVREDELAVDVLAIFEKFNFDDLLVVDARRRLVGAIDIQDLPKFKIL